MSNNGARKWQDLYDWQRDAAIAWQRGELSAHERAELAIDVAPEAAAKALDAVIAPWAVPYELEMRAQQDEVARACVGLGQAIAEFVDSEPYATAEEARRSVNEAFRVMRETGKRDAYARAILRTTKAWGRSAAVSPIQADAPTHPLAGVSVPYSEIAADAIARSIAWPFTCRGCGGHRCYVRGGGAMCADCGAAVSP